jgi:error-prone DNA polymerase
MTASRLTLLVENPTGYKTSAALTAGLEQAKGEPLSRSSRSPRAGGLHCLTGGDEGLAARALTEGGLDAAGALLDSLAAIFPGRLHVELQRHRLAAQEHRNRAFVDLARARRLPLLATNGVRYAHPKDKESLEELCLD